MEPWFAWSYLLGIRPIHPSGWVALGTWFLVGAPLGFGFIGAFGDSPFLRAICAFGFAASAVAFFWLVLSRMAERAD